jgi:hypothetical protein
MKGRTARIVPNHPGFEKRNRFGLLTRIVATESVSLCVWMKS